MRRRLISIVLSLATAVPVVSPPAARPGPAPAADASHSASCCCTPCPGPATCPCGHGDAAKDLCGKTQDPTPLASSTPTKPPPTSKVACELPSWNLSEPCARQSEAAELRPLLPTFAEPPDKVPIA